MRIFALAAFLTLAAAGCIPDTRPTCQVACDNQVRCGFFPDRDTCLTECNRRFAMASSDCRTSSDSYHRCWIAANTCPLSDTSAAPGCSSEFTNRALSCTTAAPLTSADGI